MMNEQSRDRDTLTSMIILARSPKRSLYACIGPLLLIGGAVLLVYPLAFPLESLTVQDLLIALLGTAAISTGWALSVFYYIALIAHELLLRLDEIHGVGHDAQFNPEQQRTAPECDDSL